MIVLNRFRVSAGTIIGRTHTMRQSNCQDAFSFAVAADYAAGVLCDGCGEGSASEIGAKLAARYLTQEAVTLFLKGAAPADLPGTLYPALIEYLGGLLNLQRISEMMGRQIFVKQHLLFTVLGFVLSKESGVIFTAGDGLVYIDGSLRKLEHGNLPPYPAYHLVATDIIPFGFEVTAFDPGSLQYLGLASDGFDAELFDELHGLTRHRRAIQRKLNVWSNKEKRFLDDATVIWLERV